MSTLIAAEPVTDASTSTILKIRGLIDSVCNFRQVQLLSELKGAPSKLRLESVVYCVQNGLEIGLWWELPKSHELIMTLAGRGKLDFESMEGLLSPPEAVGISVIVNPDAIKSHFQVIKAGMSTSIVVSIICNFNEFCFVNSVMMSTSKPFQFPLLSFISKGINPA